MISSRSAILYRKLSTSSALFRPCLSNQYKSKSLWDKRLSCKLLSLDDNMIQNIDNKILSAAQLNNLEVDIFINSASPRKHETAPLEESARLVRGLRKSLLAHTVLPSTHSAICRLFLYSERLKNLATLLSNRTTFGIFPDFFSMNLILDEALVMDDYALASKFASLVMLQEEYGLNQITDCLSLYSLAKYVESGLNLESWPSDDLKNDEIISASLGIKFESSDSKQSEETNQEDVGEDDADYVRIPFLRNPYNDDHFDLTDPKLIIGKSLANLGDSILIKGEKELGYRSRVIGNLLRARWNSVLKDLVICQNASIDMGDAKVIIRNHICDKIVEDPEISDKVSALEIMEQLPSSGKPLSSLVEERLVITPDIERVDIDQFMESLNENSQRRHRALEARERKELREKLRKEITIKKEELERREQYLYFYDNLMKSRVTRIDYD